MLAEDDTEGGGSIDGATPLEVDELECAATPLSSPSSEEDDAEGEEAPSAAAAVAEEANGAEKVRVAGGRGRHRPRVLLAASGSVAAVKFAAIANLLVQWADVKAVATASALHFIRTPMPAEVPLYTDEDEWSSWNKMGDPVLHIELRRWADVLVIAPCSANTLAKLAGGLCDNLLTCVVRAWDFSKPLLVAPAMNNFMWESPFTSSHVASLKALGVETIPPISKKLACGDFGYGAMAEPAGVVTAVEAALKELPAAKRARTQPGL